MLNSTGATTVGSFVEQQLALIMDTDEPTFKIIYPKVKDQRKGINECGPLSIAFATQLAFSNKLTYVDFKIPELRAHLLKCLKLGKFEPFPKDGEETATRRIASEIVKVCCTCRLPPHFDINTIQCSKCRKDCHYKCHGVVQTPTARRWLCNVCKKD